MNYGQLVPYIGKLVKIAQAYEFMGKEMDHTIEGVVRSVDAGWIVVGKEDGSNEMWELSEVKSIREFNDEDWIEKLKKLAMDNYENGGDTMIECWDKSDWLEFIQNNEGKDLVAELKSDMQLMKDREDDIKGEIF
jgi:hypothetical protein